MEISPDGFWEKMNEQNIGQTYGDPGWVRKIADQMNGQTRDAQLEFFILFYSDNMQMFLLLILMHQTMMNYYLGKIQQVL